MDEIKLPDEEYMSIENDGRKITVCTMRQKAIHMIGLDDPPHHQPYTRHGKKFYRPYRNYFYASKYGDRDLDILEKVGYVYRKVVAKGTYQESVWYGFTRSGLDWLGEQLGIHIYTPK